MLILITQREDKMPKQLIEKQMDEYLVRKAPFQIPENGRKMIADWSPIIALVFGVIAVLAAISLWRSGYYINDAVRVLNEYSASLGVESRANELGLMFYASLLALLVQGLLLLLAYPGLKRKSKAKGWDLLLYGSLASFAYGVFVSFTNYGDISNLIGVTVGVVISLYILAQIKTQYSGQTAKKPTVKK